MLNTISALLAASYLTVIAAQLTCNITDPFPTNTDFSAVLINHSIYLITNHSAQFGIWTLDLSQGLSVKECLPWQPPLFSDILGPNETSYQDIVAFRGFNDSIYLQPGHTDPHASVSVVRYDTLGSWEILETPGTIPFARVQQTASTNRVTDLAWFFGGWSQAADGSKTYYNHFYSFDPKAHEWNWPQVKYAWGQRPARYGHSANLIMHQLTILGGEPAVFNSSSNTWVTALPGLQSILVFDTIQLQAVSMITLGDIPPITNGFSAVVKPGSSHIVIFGGYDATAPSFQPSQDVYIMDTCTLTWSKAQTTGVAPAGRSHHAAVVYGDYMIILLGNTLPTAEPNDSIGILDLRNWTWVDHLPPINPYESVGSAARGPECMFEFPNMPHHDIDNGGDGTSGSTNPTVISNPNGGSLSTKAAFGIGFGVAGFLIVSAALGYFLYRQRKNAHVNNPRWLPAKLKRSTAANKQNPISPSSANNDYPLASVDSKIKQPSDSEHP
ncbi:uncharacterized protein BYT42DRAFT_321055 [Radiomyces spectabilis]|uniref:uncharacterized protein n=1 Tax=Radiomyces spectabilis TaxID=64574 RepID=UPI00221E7BB4|nr:uncharacterized protein BYT42DRAFT_321055 [Radiomyces spectabilis]KAI8379271.1 hypothetical protein BYT42DRAFT_321055 [Radiomyces spectabilis]